MTELRDFATVRHRLFNFGKLANSLKDGLWFQDANISIFLASNFCSFFDGNAFCKFRGVRAG